MRSRISLEKVSAPKMPISREGSFCFCSSSISMMRTA